MACLALIRSITLSYTSGVNYINNCIYTVVNIVVFRAIRECSEYGRRYERHYHDCCQNERKNLFHVFFPFEKCILLGPSCHAFDKILCLIRRPDTMLIAPAYQASIDTLRHSITSRKIFYTTFRFLSRPFEKIFSKNKKKLSIFHTRIAVLSYYGRLVFYSLFFVNCFLTAYLFLITCFSVLSFHQSFTYETIDFQPELCYNYYVKIQQEVRL